jgi:hypothetical protein
MLVRQAIILRALLSKRARAFLVFWALLSMVSVKGQMRDSTVAHASRPAARAPAPEVLPGRGLAQHDFLYAGEWDTRMEHELRTAGSVDPRSVHGQFRHIRMTTAGTYLIAHLNLGKVIEYDRNWDSIWSVEAPSAWAAIRLKNGNAPLYRAGR